MRSLRNLFDTRYERKKEEKSRKGILDLLLYFFWETQSREYWGIADDPVFVCSSSDPALRVIENDGNVLMGSIEP